MPSPITIIVRNNMFTTPKHLILGDSEDTPPPNIISYHQTRKGSVNDILGLGQFGGAGQMIDYISTKWDVATVREYVRIFGEVRGSQYAEALKALFNFNINTIISQVLSGNIFNTYNWSSIVSQFGSSLKIQLPFLDYTLNAFVLKDEVDAVPGTVDRYRYDITFVGITSDWAPPPVPGERRDIR